jgi:hypothetical protein
MDADPPAPHRRDRRRRLWRSRRADAQPRPGRARQGHAVLADGRRQQRQPTVAGTRAAGSSGWPRPCPSRGSSTCWPGAKSLPARSACVSGACAALVYGLGALLTAVAVTTVGSVGFIGLIVPHLVRLAIGNDQRLLLPAATLAGGVLLCAADTAARTVVAPIQLPVGVLTALIGVPVFLFPAGEPSAMKMDARPPILGADRLSVEIGRHSVCRELDFTLQPGDTLVILGRNGAGKSTLLHTLAGLREPLGVRCCWRASPTAPGRAVTKPACAACWPRASPIFSAPPCSKPPSSAATPTWAAGTGKAPKTKPSPWMPSPRWASKALPNARCRRSPGASASASPSPRCWCSSHACICSTNPSPTSTCTTKSPLLLFGDGEWLAGPAAEVINATKASTRLYGHPLARALR